MQLLTGLVYTTDELRQALDYVSRSSYSLKTGTRHCAFGQTSPLCVFQEGPPRRDRLDA